MESDYWKSRNVDPYDGQWELTRKQLDKIKDAVRKLNFDLEILKNDPNNDFYAIMKSFYNGAKHEWHSRCFETIKECREWAKDKLKEDGWRILWIKS